MAQIKQLESEAQWEGVLEQSKEKPVLVFKHSTTCPVSAAAYNEYTSYETTIDKYFLKVRESRPVSNKIADDLQITHQSPQIFLVHHEKALWNASHWHITGVEIEKAVKEHLNQ